MHFNRYPFLCSLLFTLSAISAPGAFAQEVADKRIAITFDDLPLASVKHSDLAYMRDVTQNLLRVLQQNKVPALGFVNEIQLQRQGELDARAAVLESWLIAGMELGNHNYAHLGLWEHSLQQNQDAVVQGEIVSRRLSAQYQRPYRYYRHPYTQTGKDENEKRAFEEFLTAHRYQVAPFTITNEDYLYACVYERHADKADDQAQIAAAYQAHTLNATLAYEKISQELFARQIPQILLLHANKLNADTLQQTLDQLQKRGYRFISLEDALKDPAYQTPTAASKQYGASWLTRWARFEKRKLSIYGHADPEKKISDTIQLECSF